ncbi:Transcription factor lhw [Thalictrum thalictroides]|uniref:Transcription factor lhw n=1 Tax=Thalictrum thalictroides TaxID=46969 RepID=A0A7J6X5H8_THATH|nr:Transcription factor lhw [Thalictrum thalictroides]
MSLQIKEVLKNLCCTHGWSYGLFWGVNPQNSMLLTIEDAYFEEVMGMVFNNMMQQIHMLGEGIIGGTAFSGKHHWMFSDAFYQGWGLTGSASNQHGFQDISEFHRQFSVGIKTIALISVAAPQGVVQFGSTEKIPERLDFVDHIRYIFQHLASVDGQLSRYVPMASGPEVYDPNSTISPVFSSGSSLPSHGSNNTMNDVSSKELIGNTQFPMLVPQYASFNTGLQNGKVTPLISNSFCLQNSFQTASAEAEFILTSPNMQSPQVLSQLISSSANTAAFRNPTWSTEESSWTLFDQQMLSGMGMEESSGTVTAKSDMSVSCESKYLNLQREISLSSPQFISQVPNTADTTALPVGYSMIEVVDDQVSSPLIQATESEHRKGSTGFQMLASGAKPASDMVDSNPGTTNKLSQWIAQSFEQGNNVVGADLNKYLSETQAFASSSGHENIESNSADNVNSMTNTIYSLRDVCAEKGDLAMQVPAESDLFANLEMEFVQSQRTECWDDYTLPVVSGSHSSLSTCASEGISDLDLGSTSTQKGFFTDPRLEQMLEGVINKTFDTKEYQMSTTATPGRTTATEAAIVTSSEPMPNSHINLASHSCLAGSETKGDSLRKCRLDKTNMQKNQKLTELIGDVGLRIDDSYSINAESVTSTHSKKPEEAAKATRRKGQPRESARPRPKDRQQIQDRVKELREIVPNGGKCSIDALLDRTIKHMLFLQSVTKYADKLQELDEPKIIGDENGVILKDKSSGSGATWAFEVTGQTMVCPIIVEDLSPPGQMLVEMLCEERGYFLEIADTIRGFGLTILKGMMEIRDDKIWARFIVEANRVITRMDIFLSLVQLLQQTSTKGVISKNQLNKGADSGFPMFTNRHQSPIQAPVGLSDQLH